MIHRAACLRIAHDPDKISFMDNRSVYRDICFPVTAEFRGKLNILLTDAHEKAAAEVQEQIRGQEESFMPAQDFPDMDLPTR